MSEQYLPHLIILAYPLRQLTAPLFEEQAKEIIRRHGCTIEEYQEGCTIFFPEGTTKTEILPRTICQWFWIKLPDGYKLYESYDQYREISLLLFSPE